MTVKFENPPINELIIASYFDPPPVDLRSEHIGLYWHRIRKEFPKCSQQPPLGGAEILTNAPSEIYPMARFWFISEDDVMLQQVQKNAFMFNWRRRDSDYPHFDEHLKPAFDRHYARFAEFVREETAADLLIDVAELTYVNTIEPCDYWTGPGDTPNVIPTISQIDIGVSGAQPGAMNCTFTYMTDGDVNLKVAIRDAFAVSDSTKPMLVFEIRATAKLGQATKNDADAWWERAHASIIECFTGMTNAEVQHTYWRKREVAQ